MTKIIAVTLALAFAALAVGCTDEPMTPPSKPIAAKPKPVVVETVVAAAPQPSPPTADEIAKAVVDRLKAECPGFCPIKKKPVVKKPAPKPPVAPAPKVVIAPPPPPVMASACPNGWTLTAFERSLVMPAGLSREQAEWFTGLRKEAEGRVAAAQVRDAKDGQDPNAYRTDAVSRTMGERLLKVALAPVTADIVMRYVDKDPQQRNIVTPVGVMKMVNGRGTFVFTVDPRRHEFISAVFPAGFSPALSGPPGQLIREIRIHRSEVVDCRFYITGIAAM